MKEGEPKELDAPASERARRPSAHSGTPAAIGEELGKLEFEPDALLDGLFGEGSAPPPVAERPSFAPVPVKHSSIPPAPSQEPPPPSPVNTRPVRFAPWAAGASPRISTRALGSPNPGTGLAQKVSARNAARFTRAISPQYERSRAHLLHVTMS